MIRSLPTVPSLKQSPPFKTDITILNKRNDFPDFIFAGKPFMPNGGASMADSV